MWEASNDVTKTNPQLFPILSSVGKWWSALSTEGRQPIYCFTNTAGPYGFDASVCFFIASRGQCFLFFFNRTDFQPVKWRLSWFLKEICKSGSLLFGMIFSSVCWVMWIHLMFHLQLDCKDINDGEVLPIFGDNHRACALCLEKLGG